jgi:hypothetical protein
MYKIVNDRNWSRDIDASKILMPWAKYERTPAYAERQIDQVSTDLDEQVHKAMDSWLSMTQEYLTTIVGPYASPGRPALTMPATVSHPGKQMPSPDTFLDHVLKYVYVNVPLGALIGLGDIPLPPLSSVESAMEQRREVLAQMTVHLLPALEAKAMESVDYFLSATQLGIPGAIRDYIGAIRLTGTPGPHPPLVKLAEHEHWPSDVAENPIFQYLLPTATEEEIDDDEPE